MYCIKRQKPMVLKVVSFNLFRILASCFLGKKKLNQSTPNDHRSDYITIHQGSVIKYFVFLHLGLIPFSRKRRK